MSSDLCIGIFDPIMVTDPTTYRTKICYTDILEGKAIRRRKRFHMLSDIPATCIKT